MHRALGHQNPIGRTLGHYRICEEVGQGGMGDVYRAHDEHLNREVAIKVLTSGTLADESARNRFRKEALALSKLNHPNIATIHDFDTHEEIDFLVMEYISGETLHDKVSYGPLPEKEIVGLGAQLADALAAAHAQGVIHRDLKPQNVRVTPEGRLKVLDFGIAKLVPPPDYQGSTASLSDSRFAGTLPYMSPEQLREEKVDARSDIWAAGAVLYRLATGQRPFRAPGAAVIESILHDAPVPPSTLNHRISPGLEAVILKCLDKDPDNRYQSSRELAVDLRRLGGTIELGTAPHRPHRRSPPVPHLVIAAALLVVAILLAGSPRMRRWSFTASPIKSIAVLPLDTFAGDPEQEYFSDGITDALITELAQLKALKVISRTSSMQYKHANKPLPQIARELNVDAVVEGSVQRSGDRVAVSVQLVDASDRHLLARRLEREARDVLALEREVARVIAGEIKVTLTPQEHQRLASAPRVDPAAHEAYLRGEFLSSGTNEQRRQAKEYFEQAVRIDSNYAPAYAGLARYYWAYTELDARVGMPLAREYAAKAVQLDPNLASAHTTLGSIYFYADRNWAAANDAFQRAIDLNPNDAEARRMYSVYLSALARVDEALAQVQQARELDPSSPRVPQTAGWDLYWARSYKEAVEQCQSVLKVDPDSDGAQDCLGAAYTAQGRHEEAIAASRRAVELTHAEPVMLVGLGRAYALAGRQREARRVLEQLRHQAKRTYVSPSYVAALHLALGEKEPALTWLEKAYHERDRYLVWMKVDPAFDPLRADPRFQSLLIRVGFPQ